MVFFQVLQSLSRNMISLVVGFFPPLPLTVEADHGNFITEKESNSLFN